MTMACAATSRKYPAGRTGTTAGYMAHYYKKEPACPECVVGHREQTRQRRVDDPLEHLRVNLWSRFRMTLDQYYALLEKQDGKCAICGVSAPTDIRTSRFHVDHDHGCCPGRKACGSCNRGLLCHACNTALGNFQDDTERLARAIEYLTDWRSGRAGS